MICAKAAGSEISLLSPKLWFKIGAEPSVGVQERPISALCYLF